MVLERVAVHVHLRHDGRQRICVFDLLERDVLALRQLEQVLLAVDDLQPALGVKEANVARVQPAVGIERLGCVLLVLVVAFEDVLAADQDLAARVRQIGVLRSRAGSGDQSPSRSQTLISVLTR